MTARDIVRRALLRIGVLARGEVMSAEDLADGLLSINQILAGWALERLMVYQVTTVSIPLVSGTTDYTIAAPAAIREQGRLVDGSGRFANVMLIRDLSGKPDDHNQANPFPFYGATNNHLSYRSDPTGWSFTVPDVTGWSSLEIDTLNLPTAINEATEFNLPNGYERALILALAKELAPEYEMTFSAELMDQYTQVIRQIKRANSAPILSTPDPTLMAMSRC